MSNNDWLTHLKNSPVAKLNPHLFDKTQMSDTKKKSKYHAQKVDAEGLTFDSKKEYKRYKELKLLLKVGEIGFLARQVEYTFHIKGGKVASYFADFIYTDAKTGQLIVEDVKSEATRKLPVYRLKRKMMLEQHKIKIKEV
jgi:hypothetical protein